MSHRRILIAFIAFALLPRCSNESRLQGDGAGDTPGDWPETAQDGLETSDAAGEDEGGDVAECIQSYGECGCHAPCLGGYSDYVWYPRDAGGPFPSTSSPPPELLAIGVARHVCAECACENYWRIKEGDTWTDVTVEEMCRFIADYDRACGGCLDRWEGYGE